MCTDGCCEDEGGKLMTVTAKFRLGVSSLESHEVLCS